MSKQHDRVFSFFSDHKSRHAFTFAFLAAAAMSVTGHLFQKTKHKNQNNIFKLNYLRCCVCERRELEKETRANCQ